MKFLNRKSPSQRKSTGLCWREETLCLVHLEPGGDHPLRLTVCDFWEGHNPEVLAAGLLESTRRHGLTGTSTVAVLDLGRYNLFQLEPPEVPEAEIRDAVRWNLKGLIDYPLEDAVIDLFPVPHEDLRSHSRLFQVVATPLTEVRRHEVLMHHAKLKIAAIDITELAIRNIAALLPENRRGLAFLHFGPQHGLISIFRDSKLYLTRTINFGYFDLLRFTREETQPANGLSPQLAELLNSVVLEVQRSLDFFESTFAQAPIETVMIGPLEFQVPDLLPHLQRTLGVTVRYLDLTSVLDCQGLSPAEQARALPAIGGALREE